MKSRLNDNYKNINSSSIINIVLNFYTTEKVPKWKKEVSTFANAKHMSTLMLDGFADVFKNMRHLWLSFIFGRTVYGTYISPINVASFRFRTQDREGDVWNQHVIVNDMLDVYRLKFSKSRVRVE